MKWHWPPATRQEIRELILFLLGVFGLLYVMARHSDSTGLAAVFAGLAAGGVGAGKLRNREEKQDERTNGNGYEPTGPPPRDT